MPGTETPDAQAAADAAKAAAEAAAAAAASAAPKKIEMTQEEFDRIIADRVARAKPKDYDDLVKIRDDQAAAEEAKKTELQKEKDARAAAEQKSKDRASIADAKLRKAAILTEATAQKAIDADIVVALLIGSDAIEVNDDGDVTGAKEAVAKLLKDKPVLVAGTTSRSGAEFGGNDPKTVAAQIAAIEQAASDPKLTARERQDKLAEARALKINASIV